ncbi:MAG: hypothetical protein QW101_06545 [Ignisphaera sp.]|uniref:Flagellin n=1 Tax=Ignisphaera aggregans TaxID=334771 RepID=A0A7J3MWC8_9CREN
MVSETISVSIIVVAGIIIASAIATTLLVQMNTIDSVVKLSLRNTRERLETSIKIVSVALNVSRNDSGRYFILYMKNIGNRDISLNNVNLIDIYIDDGSTQRLYRYNRTCDIGCWNYTEVIVDGIWSKGETLIIKLYNGTQYKVPLNVKVVLPNSIGDEYVYSG